MWRRARTRVSGASIAGPRPENQDRWDFRHLRGEGCAVALADGLGGHADGARAAAVAVRAALGAVRRAPAGDLDAAVRAGFSAAIGAVAEERRRRGNDMGTTLCLLVLDAKAAAWGHVGDSRIYRLGESGEAQRLTIDHSVAMAALPEDQRLYAAPRSLEGRNRLVSVLGTDDPLVDYGAEPLAAGWGYALCSDGFWETAPDDGLFIGYRPDAEADQLVDAALARQGSNGDNISLILVRPGGYRGA